MYPPSKNNNTVSTMMISKPSHKDHLLSLPNNVWRLIVFAPFLIIIFIIIILILLSFREP